jgi:hypothetical protein
MMYAAIRRAMPRWPSDALRLWQQLCRRVASMQAASNCANQAIRSVALI